MTQGRDLSQVAASELDMKLYAGIEVLKSQQGEISRRINKIEDRLEKSLLDPSRVDDLETWREEQSQPTPWRDYVVQAIMWGIGITVLAALGKLVGVEVVW